MTKVRQLKRCDYHYKCLWLKSNYLILALRIWKQTWILSSLLPINTKFFLCALYPPSLAWLQLFLTLFHLLERGWLEGMTDVQWESTLAQLTRVLQYGRSSIAEWRSSTMTKAIKQHLLVLLSRITKGWLVMLLRTRLPPTQPTLSLVFDLLLSSFTCLYLLFYVYK